MQMFVLGKKNNKEKNKVLLSTRAVFQNLRYL